MRTKIFLVLMGIGVFLSQLFGCKSVGDGFESVSADEFARCIADTGVVLLDVRTSGEYAEGHLARAVNLDVLQESFEKRCTDVLKEGAVVAVYCRSGNRSKKAACLLVQLGYRVVELDNGYKGWVQQGLSVEK